MACRPSGSGSYTVVIIPLRTSLYSLDALRFYLWIKRLKDLEKEKDALWTGLEILEKARLWYLQRLEENSARQGGAAEAQACILRSRIQRVNGSLGSVMTEPNVMSSSSTSPSETLADSDLRWRNSLLAQVVVQMAKEEEIDEVSEKNRQISALELENDALLEQLDELQTH